MAKTQLENTIDEMINDFSKQTKLIIKDMSPKERREELKNAISVFCSRETQAGVPIVKYIIEVFQRDFPELQEDYEKIMALI
jgi:hypothetical protein